MKVLRVLNELKPSGVEVNLRVAAGEWATRGIKLDILSMGPTPGPYARPLEEAGYRVHHIPLRPFNRFVPRYARLLRDARYDLVHVHAERANVYTCSLARLVTRRPVVRSIHNGFTFEGALRLRRKAQRAFLRRLGVTYVSVSASVQETERRFFGNETLCVYNSYDEARFRLPDDVERSRAREALGIGPEEFVVVSVGNCSSVKNHVAILDAVDKLRVELPIRYLHIGLEDDADSERALADRLGLSGHVSFMGHVDDPAPVLHAADSYVMPSLYEGFSNAALEALGCGLPSVLADVRGLRDLASFFPTIRWVRPEADSVERALRAVGRMEPGELEELRTKQAARAQRHFGLARAVDQYESLYRSLVKKGIGSAPNAPQEQQL